MDFDLDLVHFIKPLMSGRIAILLLLTHIFHLAISCNSQKKPKEMVLAKNLGQYREDNSINNTTHTNVGMLVGISTAVALGIALLCCLCQQCLNCLGLWGVYNRATSVSRNKTPHPTSSVIRSEHQKHGLSQV